MGRRLAHAIAQVHGLRTLHFHIWLAGGYWTMSHHSSARTTYYISRNGLLVFIGYVTQVHGQRTLHFHRWLALVTGPCHITQNYTPALSSCVVTVSLLFCTCPPWTLNLSFRHGRHVPVVHSRTSDWHVDDPSITTTRQLNSVGIICTSRVQQSPSAASVHLIVFGEMEIQASK